MIWEFRKILGTGHCFLRITGTTLINNRWNFKISTMRLKNTKAWCSYCDWWGQAVTVSRWGNVTGLDSQVSDKITCHHDNVTPPCRKGPAGKNSNTSLNGHASWYATSKVVIISAWFSVSDCRLLQSSSGDCHNPPMCSAVAVYVIQSYSSQNATQR